jgi:5-methylcytosine-specific restriction protein A
LDFETRYGKLGMGFIHVHHVVEISKVGRRYKVNPKKDLQPVCPNCRAMLHRNDPMLSIEQLKALLIDY